MSILGKLGEASENLFERMNQDEFELVGDAPGPTPSAPLGNAGAFIGANAWEVLRDWEREYGPFVRFWILGDLVVCPTSPELTERVFVTGRSDYYKDSPRAALLPLLTEVESFLANEPEWEGISERTPLRLPGVQAWLARQVPALRRSVSEHMVDLSSRGAGDDALEVLRRTAFAAFSRMAAGDPLDDQAWRAFFRMAEEGDQRMSGPLLTGEKSLDPGFLMARRALWGAFSERIAAARAAGPGDRADMLAFALRSGSPLSDEQLAAALANLYFSGLFSSTSALQTTLWALSDHEADRDAVRAEADSLPADFTLAQVEALPHLDRCLREALRLHPPVPIYLRRSHRERRVELGGWTLKENTQLFLCNFAVHRSARYWDEPDAWRPERWTPARIAERPYGSGTFWPFGRGPRSCSGEAVATAFIKTAVVEILRGWEVEVGPGCAYEPEHFFACMSAKGLPWRLRSR